MPRSSKQSDAWAAMLAKELAPAKRPEGGKRFDDIASMLKRAGIPSGGTAAHHWIRARIKEGSMKSVQVFEREQSGRKKRRVYYVPTN